MGLYGYLRKHIHFCSLHANSKEGERFFVLSPMNAFSSICPTVGRPAVRDKEYPGAVIAMPFDLYTCFR